MESSNIDFNDVEELACYLCGIEEDLDLDKIDFIFDEKYDCSMDSFHRILEDILPMVDISRNLLTQEIYKGFSTTEEGYKVWIIKEKVE